MITKINGKTIQVVDRSPIYCWCGKALAHDGDNENNIIDKNGVSFDTFWISCTEYIEKNEQEHDSYLVARISSRSRKE